jgi:benzylsuccinate CoA-transferase BbsF subunit
MDLLAEGILDYTMNDREPERDGNRDPFMAPHGNFRCKDLPEPILGITIDTWVSIAATSDDDWRRLAQVVGRPSLADDPKFRDLQARKRNEDELEQIITAWTTQHTADEAAERIQKAGVAAFVCATNKDIAENPHLNERRYFVELDHPEVGVQKHCGMPWKMSATPCEVKAPAPVMGQHTEEVLTTILGYSRDDVTRLRAAGALT